MWVWPLGKWEEASRPSVSWTKMKNRARIFGLMVFPIFSLQFEDLVSTKPVEFCVWSLFQVFELRFCDVLWRKIVSLFLFWFVNCDGEDQTRRSHLPQVDRGHEVHPHLQQVFTAVLVDTVDRRCRRSTSNHSSDTSSCNRHFGKWQLEICSGIFKCEMSNLIQNR